MSVLPALVGLRHEDHESETSLGFIVRLSQKQNKKTQTTTTKIRPTLQYHYLTLARMAKIKTSGDWQGFGKTGPSCLLWKTICQVMK
jgi:hypothetical protein